MCTDQPYSSAVSCTRNERCLPRSNTLMLRQLSNRCHSYPAASICGPPEAINLELRSRVILCHMSDRRANAQFVPSCSGLGPLLDIIHQCRYSPECVYFDTHANRHSRSAGLTTQHLYNPRGNLTARTKVKSRPHSSGEDVQSVNKLPELQSTTCFCSNHASSKSYSCDSSSSVDTIRISRTLGYPR